MCDLDDFYITSRTVHRFNSDKPSIIQGNKPWDGGFLILDEDEKEALVSQYPQLTSCIKLFLRSYELIKGKKRYCLWLKGVNPALYYDIPQIKERLKGVAEVRRQTKTEAVRKQAEQPMLFSQIRQPNTTYLAVPEVSGESRRYIPLAFLDKDVIASNKLYMIPGADLYMFGVLESNIHMAWMRTVAGRLGLSYSYSPAVYNNFPWPEPTDAQRLEIEKTAQGILDARALYPENTLAEMYDPYTMHPELSEAHNKNNRAVMNAYGFSVKNTTEASSVAALMKIYKKLSSNE